MAKNESFIDGPGSPLDEAYQRQRAAQAEERRELLKIAAESKKREIAIAKRKRKKSGE